jgi:septal ring factor EnvC (AmiA/AmiB activator)
MEKRMKNSIQRAAMRTFGVACALFAAWAYAQGGNPQAVTTTVAEQQQTNKAAASSQSRINQLDDETQKMLDDYRATLRETDSLRRYNEQLELQIKSQMEEMAQIQQDIEEIERTNREIYPLMQRMIETLDQFVKLDLPFLLEDRTKRVATLKETLVRADVTTAEKFRRLLEAYAIEMEYGRTSEATEGKLGEGDAARTVSFLRIGRTALIYQTLDGEETGYWDVDKKAWVEDNGYDDAVKHALKVVRQLTAPDLIIAPVRAPEAAAQETK